MDNIQTEAKTNEEPELSILLFGTYRALILNQQLNRVGGLGAAAAVPTHAIDNACSLFSYTLS